MIMSNTEWQSLDEVIETIERALERKMGFPLSLGILVDADSFEIKLDVTYAETTEPFVIADRAMGQRFVEAGLIDDIWLDDWQDGETEDLVVAIGNDYGDYVALAKLIEWATDGRYAYDRIMVGRGEVYMVGLVHQEPSASPVSLAPNEAYIVAITMKAVGGSFVAHLGEALLRADLENQRKIKAAWPGIWADYYAMGLRRYHAGLSHSKGECEWCDWLRLVGE